MADSFNPYAEWLGLPPHLVEPNHYQLLGLADFEADTSKIAAAADRATAKVRSFRPGPNARAWSKLLDELLLAKAHLTEAERKAEYDAELREQPSPVTGSAANTPQTAAKHDQGSRAPDSRFPPGMGPNEGRGVNAEKSPAAIEPVESQAESKPPEAATQLPPPSTVPAPAPLAVPLAQPAPMAAWPASMLHPVPHAAAPTGYPQAPHPQAPTAYPAGQPVYGAPAYGAPGYGPAPHAQPGYAQPGYAQPAYGQPPPYGMPSYGAPYGQPVPGYPAGQVAPPAPPVNYGAPYPPHPSPYDQSQAPSLDPMAPVALPPALPGTNEESKQARVVGFAAAGASPAGIPTGSIPKGKAVSSAPAAASERQTVSSPLAASLSPTISTGPFSGPSAIPRGELATYSPPSSSEKLVLYGTISAVILLVGAIVFAIANANRGGDDLAENPAPAAPAPKTLPRFEPPVVKPSNSPNSGSNSPANSIPAQKSPQSDTEVTRPMPPAPQPDPFLPEPAKPEVPQPEPLKPEPPKPEPVKPEPPKPEPPQPEPAKPEPPKPAEPMPKPPEPKPADPKPPEPMPEVKLTPVELETLSKSAKTAREALSERNFDEFEKQLAVATQLAKSPNQMEQINRLKMLGDYVKQFDRQLKSLLTDDNFDAGAELRIGKSTVVNVVERSTTTLVIRVAGVNKSYNVSSLPDGLAMALIDKRLDANDPVRHLVKGAYLAATKVQTDETKQKAKELFDQATREGADAGDLALVLTDTYEFKE